MSIKGYYIKKDIWEEDNVEPSFNHTYCVKEEDLKDLPVGEIFTGQNGQWYIKVDENDYRPWRWSSSISTH